MEKNVFLLWLTATSISVVLAGCGGVQPETHISATHEQQLAGETLQWFADAHQDKIAHVDLERNIVQIKVINQIGLGSRQCGYHAIRNYFYLAALGVALQNKNSVLIDTLYRELHDVEAFTLFVDRLAALKECPREYYHHLFPEANELRTLYREARGGFPSSFSIDDIMEYGDFPFLENQFAFYKYPTEAMLTGNRFYFDAIEQFERDFDTAIPLTPAQKKLMAINHPHDFLSQVHAVNRLKQHKVLALEILLHAEINHAAAASMILPPSEEKPLLILADSWGDESFKNGWLKGTADVLTDYLSDFENTRNKGLMWLFLHTFNRSVLFHNGNLPEDKSLTALFQEVPNAEAKQEILNRMRLITQKFKRDITKYNLETASMLPLINRLLDKVTRTYTEGLR